MKLLWLMLSIVLVMAIALTMQLGGAFKPGPVLSVEQDTLSFKELAPDSGLSKSLVFNIRNLGGRALTGTVTSDKSWLQVNPQNINLNNNGNRVAVYVNINTAGLQSGTRSSGNILVKTNGGQKAVLVDIAVLSEIITDDFKDAASGWCIVNDGNTQSQYLDGAYRMAVTRAGKYAICKNSVMGQFTDFTFSVDAHWQNHSVDPFNSYGITFRQTDANNYYFFTIYPNQQYYALVKVVNGEYIELTGKKTAPWITSTLINKGSIINRLGVTCSGTKIDLYINDSFLTSVYDSAFNRGYMGLGVENYFSDTSYPDALFANLRIIVP